MATLSFCLLLLPAVKDIGGGSGARRVSAKYRRRRRVV